MIIAVSSVELLDHLSAAIGPLVPRDVGRVYNARHA